jgi:ribosome maturation protein Sdo1
MAKKRRKINPELLKLHRIVSYGLKNNKNLDALVKRAIDENKVLVYITPRATEYSDDIVFAQNQLKDRFWIYEMNMAMKVVMTKRAKRYCEIYKNCELCE